MDINDVMREVEVLVSVIGDSIAIMEVHNGDLLLRQATVDNWNDALDFIGQAPDNAHVTVAYVG